MSPASSPFEVAAAIALGSEGGKGVTDKFDGLADDIGEAAGEARMLERPYGGSQGFLVLRRDCRGVLQRQLLI